MAPKPGRWTMNESRKDAGGSRRRTFLKAAAGTMEIRGAQWGQTGPARFPKIHAPWMLTPDQVWEWNVFKSRGGPTYAGSAGWKRYTDFLISKMHEFGAVDF